MLAHVTVQEDGRVVFSEGMPIRLGLEVGNEVGNYVLFDDDGPGAFKMTIVSAGQFETTFLEVVGGPIPAGIDFEKQVARLDPDVDKALAARIQAVKTK